MSHIAVSRGVEKVRSVGRHRGVALPESGCVVQIVSVRVRKSEVCNAELGSLWLPREAGFQRTVISVGNVLEFGKLAEAA